MPINGINNNVLLLSTMTSTKPKIPNTPMTNAIILFIALPIIIPIPIKAKPIAFPAKLTELSKKTTNFFMLINLSEVYSPCPSQFSLRLPNHLQASMELFSKLILTQNLKLV